MKMFIATVVNESWSREVVDHFRFLAASDRVKTHTIAEDAESADVILFVDLHQFPFDWQLEQLRHHPIATRYEHKIMVYDERDRPFCVFPGLYVSMAKRFFDPSRQRASSYYHLKNELMMPSSEEPDLLFSFQGANSHPVRQLIFGLSHPRAIIENTSNVNFFDFSDYSHTEEYQKQVRAQKQHFQEVVSRSKFVLCPRGAGTSSFRLYETLAAGRVPVIISDQWMPPHGPDWEACSIRVPESELNSLPSVLEAYEERWEHMAKKAKQVFEDWFAPDVLFHRMSDECQHILTHGRLGRGSLPILDSAFRAAAWIVYRNRVRAQLGKRIRALLRLKRR